MAQPEIPGTDKGKVVMPYGSTGSKWVALLVSALGRLQVDVIASALATDAATQTTLAALLTELKLKADLTETQPVSLASLPTGAATIADGADVTLGALADALVAAGAAGSLSAKLRRLTTDLDALLTELKLKADLTETQPVSSEDGDKLWGFESIVEEEIADTDLAAGVVDLGGTAVPSGKVWKLTNFSYFYSGTAPSRLHMYISGLAGNYVVVEDWSITTDHWENWAGDLFIGAGDIVRILIDSATLHDVVRLRYVGLQMNAP